MSKIKSFGMALPYCRAEENLFAGGRKGKFRSLCYPDEDCISLGYEAATKAEPAGIDAVIFATTVPVFRNRSHASFMAGLLGLSDTLITLDFTGSSRCGTDALLTADALITSGRCKKVLLIATEVRFPALGEEVHDNTGHAASAIVLSSEAGFATVAPLGSYSSFLAEEFIYKNSHIVNDPRFSREAAFKKVLTGALTSLKKSAPAYDSVIMNSLYSRMAGSAFIKAGFSETQFAKDEASGRTGNTGVVHALRWMLEEIQLGKKNILLCDYANGLNVFQIQVEKSLPSGKETPARSETLQSYHDYLLLRKSGDHEANEYKPHEMFTSEMMLERDKKSIIGLQANRCTKCGTLYYINSARCKHCGHDQFEAATLSRTGTVFAFTREHYFPSPFPPVNMLVCDLDGGGRMTLQQTDTIDQAYNKVQIGSRVRLVLRKMMPDGLKPDYFWKAQLMDDKIS